MHEMFMAQQIAEELQRLAAPHQPCRLTRVTLKVGTLRQVAGELLRFALEVALTGRAGEGAELVIDPVQPRCRCNRCGREFTVADWNYRCPDCQSGELTGLAGDELIIETVTIEKDDDTVGTNA